MAKATKMYQKHTEFYHILRDTAFFNFTAEIITI